MKTKMTRSVILAGVCVVVLATCILAWFFGTYAQVGSGRYRKDAESLDLSGASISNVEVLEGFKNLQSLDLRDTGLTMEQYRQIKTWHPDCQIRWDVPFQGGYLEDGTEAVMVTALTDADMEALSCLGSLKTVNAEACTDYAQLAQLQRNCPDVTCVYSVPVAGETWPNDAKDVVLEDADGEALLEQLAWLPDLQTVRLEGKLPAPAQMEALTAAYPALDFSWCWEIGGQKLEKDTTALEISGRRMQEEDLQKLLVYGPSLKKLVLLDTGLDGEAFQKLQEQDPELELVWDVVIEGRTFRTDITEMDLSNIPLTSVEQVEKYFPYFPKLTKVDMSYTGLSNEELDALNKKYENIRINWLVQICEKGGIRTDATYFMPYKLGTIVTDKEMELLKYCPDIICVDVGHMKITSCEFVKYLPKLQYLIVADTYVDSLEPLRGHENLIFLEAFLTEVTDYTPLLECPNLLDLNITNNFGDLTPLAQMTWLERLWVAPLEQGSHKKMPEVLMLQEALSNTQVVYTDNSTGSGWREHPRYFEMRDILEMFYLK